MNIANNLSILRVLSVPVFVTCLYYARTEPLYYTVAVWVYFAACLTDALDGYLARRLEEITVFGSYLDPIADKLLLTSGFLSLSLMGGLPILIKIPAWVTISVIARDVIILIGAIVIFFVTGKLKAAPLLTSKVTTFFQMATLAAVLFSISLEWQYAFFGVTVIITIISGIQYVRLGGRLINHGH